MNNKIEKFIFNSETFDSFLIAQHLLAIDVCIFKFAGSWLIRFNTKLDTKHPAVALKQFRR